MVFGKQGWHGGHCTYLPSIWPGLDSGLMAWYVHGLSLLLVLYSAPRGFPPSSLVFPSPQKSTLLNSSFRKLAIEVSELKIIC